MKPVLLLLLALPLSAATITHVIDLPDTTVVDLYGMQSYQNFMFLNFVAPTYSGDVSLLAGISVTYSGHLTSGFTWTMKSPGENLSFTLARSTHIDLGSWERFGEVFFAADPVTLDQWDAGTVLDYPGMIDTDFTGTFTLPGECQLVSRRPGQWPIGILPGP